MKTFGALLSLLGLSLMLLAAGLASPLLLLALSGLLLCSIGCRLVEAKPAVSRDAGRRFDAPFFAGLPMGGALLPETWTAPTDWYRELPTQTISGLRPDDDGA